MKYRVQAIEIIGKQKNLFPLLSTICIFPIFSIFPYFARFLLFSTLLVHFEISFSFAPLQYRKTKENQLFSVITRLRYLNRDKTSKQWEKLRRSLRQSEEEPRKNRGLRI